MTAPGAELRPATAYRLPERLRIALAEPWGAVVDTPTLALMLAPDDIVLAVGDMVSATLQDIGITPRLFVCDYKTQRGGEDPELRERLSVWGDNEIRVENAAGHITAEAWDAVAAGLAAPAGTMTRIVVDGEEDMLGIPCFLQAPDGAIVIYGLPGRGVVVCPVTPELRTKVAGLVAGMDAL